MWGSFFGCCSSNCRATFPETKLPLKQLIPSLGVADIARSVDFYRAYFGFDIAHSREERGSLVWCHMKSGGADIMLQQLADDQMERLRATGKRRWVMYVSPEDIYEVHRRLQGADHKVSDIERTGYDTEECYLEDPDGYELWVSAPVNGK